MHGFCVTGLNLCGFTQNNAYGDDYKGDTNYPLVRLTSLSTGHVYYATTHDESSHSIDPNAPQMTTMFDMPSGLPRGTGIFYKMELIANGIASNFVIYQ